MAQAITGLPQWLFDNTASLQVWERENAPDNSPDNSEVLTRAKRNLKSALNELLTPKQRMYLSMYYFEGLSMGEIGARVGVNKSTVSRTVARARARLNKALKYSF